MAPKSLKVAPPFELALVIVNHEAGDDLKTCLGACLTALGSIQAEIVVVDNASRDGSLDGLKEAHPLVKIIRNRNNLGFGRACNKGVAATRAPLVLFLNPDTVPSAGSFKKMMKKMVVQPGVGALGPMIVNSDGSLYPSCRVIPSLGVAVGHALLGIIWPTNPFSRRYKMLDWDHLSERQVDWVSGAAMIVRRDAFLQIKGFDEGFFMYVEDLDLCERLRLAGWVVHYDPEAQMVHHRGGSSKKAPYRLIRHHHFSMIRFWYIRSKGTPRIVLFPLMAAGLLVRLLFAWFAHFLGFAAR